MFALKYPDPKSLLIARAKGIDPVGNSNNRHLIKAAQDAPKVILAWGNNGRFEGRAGLVSELLTKHARQKLWCLGTTKPGQPRHPLYVPKQTTLIRWRSQDSKE